LDLEPKSFFSDITNSSEKFIEILNDSIIWKTFIQKQFVDLNTSLSEDISKHISGD
jgi:hypothetical protein